MITVAGVMNSPTSTRTGVLSVVRKRIASQVMTGRLQTIWLQNQINPSQLAVCAIAEIKVATAIKVNAKIIFLMISITNPFGDR